MRLKPPPDAVHLGDGAYASHDGFYVWLWAERDDGWNYVALELPHGLDALISYVKSLTPPGPERDSAGG